MQTSLLAKQIGVNWSETTKRNIRVFILCRATADALSFYDGFLAKQSQRPDEFCMEALTHARLSSPFAESQPNHQNREVGDHQLMASNTDATPSCAHHETGKWRSAICKTLRPVCV